MTFLERPYQVMERWNSGRIAYFSTPLDVHQKIEASEYLTMCRDCVKDELHGEMFILYYDELRKAKLA